MTRILIEKFWKDILGRVICFCKDTEAQKLLTWVGSSKWFVARTTVVLGKKLDEMRPGLAAIYCRSWVVEKWLLSRARC